MQIHNLFTQTESDAGPRRFRRKKRNEYFIHHFRKNPLTVITDRQTADFSGYLFQFHFNLRSSTLSTGFFCVFNQINQYLFYLCTIDVESSTSMCRRKMDKRIRK